MTRADAFPDVDTTPVPLLCRTTYGDLRHITYVGVRTLCGRRVHRFIERMDEPPDVSRVVRFADHWEGEGTCERCLNRLRGDEMRRENT